MNTSAGGQRVALYARISEDPKAEAAGIRRQIDECRALAAARGWAVVAECTDNDISALRGKVRPGYDEVLRLVRAEDIDYVVVWQTSRLLRNRRERAEAIEMFGQHRVGIIAVKGISFDLTTAYGRGQAGMMGEFDTMESEVKAERVAAAAAQRAEGGRPSGALGYGWTKHGTGSSAVYEVNPHEAAVVREIVDRLLAGESLRGITESLNQRGEPSPEAAAWAMVTEDDRRRRLNNGRKAPSAAWGTTSVKKLAIRASNVADRVHHRGLPDEVVYRGSWPALIDRKKHDKVAALLARPERRKNGGVMGQPGKVARPGARRHLLSWGAAVCGACGGNVGAHHRKTVKYGKPFVYYRCEHGCVGRKEDHLDDFVREVVLERLSRPDALDWLLGDEDEARVHGERAEELRRRLDEAAESYADGLITRDQLVRITSRLAPDLEEAERLRGQAMESLDLDVVVPLAGPAARERWDEMNVTQRRAVLDALGIRVVLDKVSHRGPTPRDEDGNPIPPGVRIEWLGGAA